MAIVVEFGWIRDGGFYRFDVRIMEIEAWRIAARTSARRFLSQQKACHGWWRRPGQGMPA
jgi:hypothetical protein